MIKDIKSRKLTNDNIVDDLADSAGGDYDGAFEDWVWGEKGDEDDEEELDEN